jgi:NAD(P)-dependent dehydrogenase (short-subunit alcohol dehydrogenase family)
MELGLAGKVVMVTGAAGSIGNGIVRGFARENAKLFITDIVEEQLRKLKEEIDSSGGVCEYHPGDVTKPADVREVVSRAQSKLGGKIDILVNTAGIAGTGRVENINEEEWDRIFAINCRGTFLFIREVVPVMKRHGYGRIINFSSKSGKTGSALMSHYSASKAAIIGLTQALAHELAEFGITVNCLCPGIVEGTRMWDGVAAGYTEKMGISMEEVMAKFTSKVPLGRLTKIEDVVSVTLFLASDVAGYLTGQAINVSGGREMH